MSLTRKYSSTAFFSHWWTCHWPPRPGLATRSSPRSSPAITSSTAVWVEPSISAVVNTVRRSHALSIVCCTPSQRLLSVFFAIIFSIYTVQQRSAQCVQGLRRLQRLVMFIGQLEKILDPLAEGGNACRVHPHPLLAQHQRHLGQQTGAIGAHQGQLAATIGQGFELYPGRYVEVAQMARQCAARWPHLRQRPRKDIAKTAADRARQLVATDAAANGRAHV